MRSSKAFTLVELLIVIVVIAILAAISIVAYNGIQERARVASVSSALTQAIKKIKLWQVDNPDTAPASLSDADITTPPNVTFQYSRASNNQDYCITATQDKTSYYLNSITQTTPTSGGCPGHGVGGVQAVTNYAVNSSAEGSMMGLVVSNGSPNITISSDVANGWPRTGSKSYKVITATSADTRVRPPTNTIPFNGQPIHASFYVRNATAATRSFFISFQGRNSSGAVAAATTGSGPPPTAVPANSIVRISGVLDGSEITGFANQNVTYVEPKLSMASGTSGDVFYVDDMFVSYGSTILGYADGNSPNWVWNGTPNNSTSTGPAR